MSPLVDVLPKQEIQQLQLTAKFFRGLGDPTRLKILDLLLERERHVTELFDLLQVPRSGFRRVDGLEMYVASQNGYGVALWKKGNLLYSLVTDLPPDELVGVAKQMAQI